MIGALINSLQIALPLSDRIVVFNDGAIEQIGNAEESSTFVGDVATTGDVTTVTLDDGTCRPTAGSQAVNGAR